MKHFLLTLALLLSFSGAINAASLFVGYCNGEIAKTGTGATGDRKMSACLKISGATLAQYKNAKITGVRVGLVTAEGVNDLAGWIRNNYRMVNLDKGTLATPQAGWNRIPLNGGLTIDGSSLYVGFDYVQHKTVNCISVVGEPRQESFLMAKDNVWSTPKNPVGVLSVELEITADNLPDTDLEVAYVTPEPLMVKKGEPVKVEFGIRNKAMQTVNKFDYTAECNGKTIHSGTSTTPLETGKTFTESFDLATTDLASNRNYPITVIVKAAGDEDETNNALAGSVAIYDEPYNRNVLFEEFTTELCPNCPRATTALNALLKSEIGGRMVAVAHHSGFYTDFLTTQNDRTWTWFFGTDGTYAPAMMLDRIPKKGEKVPVRLIGGLDDVRSQVDAALAQMTFVRLFIDATYDADTRELKFNTRAQKQAAFDVVCPKPKINIWLTEDRIEPSQPNGQAGNTDPTYVHRHAFRATMTGDWGVDMTWNGDISTSKTYTYTLPETWDADNVEIVAFVSAYDNVNRDKCPVYNAVQSGLSGTGITDTQVDVNAPVEFYDLQGRAVSTPSHGIFIKKQGNKVTKIKL